MAVLTISSSILANLIECTLCETTVSKTLLVASLDYDAFLLNSLVFYYFANVSNFLSS